MTVVVVGEMFRDGPQFSRWTNGSEAEQITAWKSFEAYVMNPLRAMGWNISLVIDVVTANETRKRMIEEWGISLQADPIRIHDATAATQLEGLLRTLEFVDKQGLGGKSNMLLVRGDLVFISAIPCPPPPVTKVAIFLPFRTWKKKDTLLSGRPRSADTFVFVPRTVARDFKQTLITNREMTSFHAIADWLPDWLVTIEYMIDSQHDSDSAKDWNPV